jgi:hypothetical protein
MKWLIKDNALMIAYISLMAVLVAVIIVLG